MRVLDTEVVSAALGGLARPPEGVLVVVEVLDREVTDDRQQLAPRLSKGVELGEVRWRGDEVMIGDQVVRLVTLVMILVMVQNQVYIVRGGGIGYGVRVVRVRW